MENKEDLTNIKRKIIGYISAIILVSFAIAIVGIFGFLDAKLNEKKEKISLFSEKMYQEELKEKRDYLKAKISLFLELDGIKDAIKKEDRERLFAIVENSFKILKSEIPHLNIMQFHNKNTTSLLRVHSPSHFGDDLTSLRTMIVDTNREKNTKSGFEVGEYGLAYRVASPIFDQSGEHLGVLELGVYIDHFKNSLSKYLNNSHIAIFAYKDRVGINTLDKRFTLFENFLFLEDANFFSSIADKIDLSSKAQIIKDNSDKYYVINSSIDILDYNSQKIAKMLIATDITDEYSLFLLQILYVLVFGTTIWILIIFLINFGFNQYVKKLRETKERLRLAHEASNDGIWDWDIENRDFYLSPRWKSMLGYKESEIENSYENFVGLLHPEDKERVLQSLDDYINRKLSTYEIKFRLKAKSGGYMWIWSKATPILDKNFKLVRIIGTHTNITKEIELENEIQAILDAQSTLVILTDGIRALNCNKRTLEFLGFDSFEAFLKEHNCICEFFIKEEGYIHKEGSTNWIDKLKLESEKGKKQKVKMIDKSKSEIRILSIDYSSPKGLENLLVVTFNDITELQLQNEQIEEQRSFLGTLLENAPLPIYVKDRDFSITSCNKKFLELFGFKSKNEVIGKKILQILGNDVEHYFDIKDKELIENKEKVQVIENRWESKSEGIKTLVFYRCPTYDAKGSFSGVIASIIDLSEQKKLEERLRVFNDELEKKVESEIETRIHSELKYRFLFNATNEAIFIVEYRDDFYKRGFFEINQTASLLFGYSKDELYSLNFEKIAPLGKYKRAKLLRSLKESGEYMDEIEAYKKDKSSLRVELRAHLFSYEGRENVFMSLANITKEKELQEESLKKDRLLIQQSKMAAVGEVIAAISYQWKQPLSLIALIAQNMRDMYEYEKITAKELDELEDKMMDNISIISKTIDDFRDFFKPSKKKMPFSVVGAIKDTYTMTKLQFDKLKIDIDIRCEKELFAFGYKNDFRLVVLNILNNTKDVIEKKVITDGKIEIEVKKEEGKLTITFEDNAGGIDENLLPDKLFEAYSTTKKSDGTGIGLYMSKSIIEDAMNGSIEAKNSNKGAVFKITIDEYKEREVIE